MLNKDFYDDLPAMVCGVLNGFIKQFSGKDWFETAWEQYRQHILTSKSNERMMPGWVFNKYIDSKIRRD